MSQSFDIHEHYERAGDVYRELGRIDGGVLPANADKTRWYHNDPGAGGKWDGRARPVTLSADFEDLEIDRTLYCSVNYAPADYFMDSWTRYRWTDDGREWKGGENPMPDYGDLVALAPFADVDLHDHVKSGRGTPNWGDPDGMLNRVLDAYIDGFADLCGGRGPVHALDSVGGAYIMVAPSVTLPIAERYDPDARALIFEEMSGRVNDFLTAVRDRVRDDVPRHDEAFDPDMVTHKNRIHKAPLSLHADLDGVVHPIDTRTPDYTFLPLHAVDDDTYARALEWANSYTADYRDRVGELVAALWDGDPAAWEDTLDAWVDQQRAGGSSGPGASSGSGGDGNPPAPDIQGQRTAPIEDVYRKLDALDAAEVAEEAGVVAEWNDDATGGKGQGFYPEWGDSSCDGTANYVNSDIWHDTGADNGKGDHGTVIELALIGADGVNWTRGEIAAGEDWIRGIRELQALGYNVPLPAGDVDDEMSQYYALDLPGIACDNGIEGDPYEDDMALLRACLYAREETPEVADGPPPYAALVTLAEVVGLDFDDAEEDILGNETYNVARRIFDDLEPGDV